MIGTCCLLLSAPPALAGKGKPNVVRSSGQHVTGGHKAGRAHLRQSRHDHFKAKRFDRRRSRPNVVRRTDRKRRPYYGSRYSSRYSYGYSWSYPYRDAPRSGSSYRPETEVTVQPYENRPVTPKWVHVGGGVAPFTSEGLDAGGGLGANCLSVKTEITVDGRPMDAFGEACLLADGTWQLKPAQEDQ